MKHLVDIDDDLLRETMSILGTPTIKATVEESMKAAIDQKAARQLEALRGLGEIFAGEPDFDRSQAW